MIEPYVLTVGDIRDLTVLELLRACALANVSRSEYAQLTTALTDPAAPPELAYRAALLAYAVAYVRELRTDPAASWAVAQTRDLRMGETDPAAEAIADDGARMLAEVSTLAGVGPAEAGALRLRDVDALAAVRTGG